MPRRKKRTKSCDRGDLHGSKPPHLRMMTPKAVSIFDKETHPSPEALGPIICKSSTPEEITPILKSPSCDLNPKRERLLRRRVTFEDAVTMGTRKQKKRHVSWTEDSSVRRRSLPLVKCSLSSGQREHSLVTQSLDQHQMPLRGSDNVVCEVVHEFLPKYCCAQPKPFKRTLYHYLS